MKLAQSYNKIAASYDENSDAFNLLTSSRFSALQEILMRQKAGASLERILDLGIGSGAFLVQLQEEFPKAQLTGVDIARKMLDIAQSRIPGLTTIESSIADIHKHDFQGTFDLIIAHFVLAYVDLDTLLQHCQTLLPKGGMLSIVTTTHESFPQFQAIIQKTMQKNTPIARLARKIYQTGLNKTTVPHAYSDIKTAAKNHGFTIANRQQISTDIHFNTPTEMTDFAVKGGWLLNALDYRLLPTGVSYQMVRQYFKRVMGFPWEDKHIVESVLLVGG